MHELTYIHQLMLHFNIIPLLLVNGAKLYLNEQGIVNVNPKYFNVTQGSKGLRNLEKYDLLLCDGFLRVVSWLIFREIHRKAINLKKGFCATLGM